MVHRVSRGKKGPQERWELKVFLASPDPLDLPERMVRMVKKVQLDQLDSVEPKESRVVQVFAVPLVKQVWPVLLVSEDQKEK